MTVSKETLYKLHYLTLIIILFVLDLVSKNYAENNFSFGQSYTTFLPFIDFFLIYNSGIAFGLFDGYGDLASNILLIITIIILAYLIRMLIQEKVQIAKLALSLIIAGALGNIIDNVFYGLIFDSGTTWNNDIGYWVGYNGVSKADFSGYSEILGGCVVDMVHLVFYWPSWAPFDLGGSEVFPPVFNLADASISVSVFFILIFYKKIVRKEDLDFSFNKKSK